MQEQERWLSVEEIAAHLGVNRDTIYKWIDRRQMPAHKLGKLWKFKATEIDAWITAGKAAAQKRPDNRLVIEKMHQHAVAVIHTGTEHHGR